MQHPLPKCGVPHPTDGFLTIDPKQNDDPDPWTHARGKSHISARQAILARMPPESQKPGGQKFRSGLEELLALKLTMQSLKDRIHALSSQLQETLEQNRTTAEDLDCVLCRTQNPTLFLDNNLHIRFFTPAMASFFHVSGGDIGRPLTAIAAFAVDGTLVTNVRTVLRTLEPIEHEMESQEGAHYRRRILPCRTGEFGVDGIVITFAEISAQQRAAGNVNHHRHQSVPARGGVGNFANLTPRVSSPSLPKGASVPPVIFIVDNDRQVRQELRKLLEAQERIVEDYASCEAFLKAWHPGREGCLLIDANLPGMSGLELLCRLRDAGDPLPSIMITGQSDVPMVVQAMKAGASDCFEKPIGNGQLLVCIERLLQQPRRATGISVWQADASRRIASLTTRQRQIMELVLAGYASKNIAYDLGISQRSVENHRALIMRKTGSKSLPALTRLAGMAASNGADGAALLPHLQETFMPAHPALRFKG